MDTTSYAGKLILTICAGIAEFERDLMKERIEAGRVSARKRGVRFGRPVKLDPDQRQVAIQLIQGGQSRKQVAAIFGVHQATIYRMKGGNAGLPTT